MKAFLMYKDSDFDLKRDPPPNEQDLIQDLALDTLFNAMALEDEFLYEVARKAVLSSIEDVDTILYRQHILKDCLRNPSVVKTIYDISLEAIKNERKVYWGLLSKSPLVILHRAMEVMQIFVGMLKKLKRIAEEDAGKFDSEGFSAFFAMLNKELSDEYFASIQNHLKELKFGRGMLISAELGKGIKGTNYILRKAPDNQKSWIKRIFAQNPPAYTFQIADRDQSGARALSELEGRGLNLVANALAQSTDHILSFFTMVRTELAFYIGCMNLREQLGRIRGPVSFPVPVASGEHSHSFTELYDACLALTMKQRIVGNDVNADHKDLVMITGANQGGKSTFLRSVGLAQLMMQCGMFVAARSYSANICQGLFTHFKRKEDVTMESGKFDEELSRMSDIVDHIRPTSLVLFNESFAATNEREGSEIARQIVSALLEKRIKVFFVTHLYEFAHGFYDKNMENALFLRAEREADGRRTFKVIEGEPLQTSYGVDLYQRIFATDNQVHYLTENLK